MKVVSIGEPAKDLLEAMFVLTMVGHHLQRHSHPVYCPTCSKEGFITRKHKKVDFSASVTWRNFHSSSTKDNHRQGPGDQQKFMISQLVRVKSHEKCGLAGENLNTEIFLEQLSGSGHVHRFQRYILIGVDVPDGLLHMQRKKIRECG